MFAGTWNKGRTRVKGSGVASGGTCPGAQALGAHRHTFCSHLKTRFEQKFRPKISHLAIDSTEFL